MATRKDKAYISPTERRVNRAGGPVGNLNDKPIYAWPYDALPKQAQQTLAKIAHGGRLPYPKDGSRYGNRGGDLPAGRDYREFTVPTPGSPRSAKNGLPDRGKRRLVLDNKGMAYYTAAHYDRAPKHVKDPAQKQALVDKAPKEWQHGFYVVTMPPALRRQLATRMATYPDPPQPAKPQRRAGKPAKASNRSPSTQGTTMATSKGPISGKFNTAAGPKPPPKPGGLTRDFNKAAGVPPKDGGGGGPAPVLKPKGGPSGPGLGGGTSRAAPPTPAPKRQAPPTPPNQSLTKNFNDKAKGPKR